MKHIAFSAFIAVSAAMAGGVAHAATFAGSFDGSFRSSTVGGGNSDSNPNSCRFSTGGGTNNGVAWGDSGNCPDVSGNNQDSRIWIPDFSFSEEITEQDQHVQIGQFNWRNQANNAAFDWDAIADLDLTLTSPVNGSVSETLRFEIDNTLNDAGDDVLLRVFQDFGLLLPGTIVNSDLTLEGFVLKNLSGGGTLSLAGIEGGFQNYLWENPERDSGYNGLSSIGVYAVVSAPAPVPLPAAGWMLMAGFGGLMAMKRRKKA